jgi:hypothetical protein
MHAAYLRIVRHWFPGLVLGDICALVINTPKIMIISIMLRTLSKPFHKDFVVYDRTMLEKREGFNR